jgi:hypothetical protein
LAWTEYGKVHIEEDKRRIEESCLRVPAGEGDQGCTLLSHFHSPLSPLVSSQKSEACRIYDMMIDELSDNLASYSTSEDPVRRDQPSRGNRGKEVKSPFFSYNLKS